MKSANFYLSLNPGPNRQPVKLTDGTAVYIRVQEVNADLSETLDRAGPAYDEAVMNAHSLDPEDWGVDGLAPRFALADNGDRTELRLVLDRDRQLGPWPR